MIKRSNERKFAKKKVRTPSPLEVVGDAAIASHLVGDGRLIPLLIVDTSTRPDLDELVRVHQYVSSGDCKSQWGTTLSGESQVLLQLEFIRPTPMTVTLCIDVAARGILIDSILMTQALYLLPGRPGDRLTTRQNDPRVLIEVPRGDFGAVWEKILRSALRKRFRDEGFDRPGARAATEELIVKMRELTGFRLKK
ncbi:hypothetical protein OG361_22160 [Streptomyces sp. NBC_00090]|uniref:hypothetical protein n=1 Tax=Streptomyces sp. NBC_00090 TaxID=2903619 RepID=UPI0032461A18